MRCEGSKEEGWVRCEGAGAREGGKGGDGSGVRGGADPLLKAPVTA